ncbi:MAG: N-acetylneuraminate synthase family protein [Planctomycetes bacterium]|nr:N-acetylneuraminate synthase family protein [Planctomycetota bacterium]
MTIGRHRVGPPHPAFIVAEAGVNHDGSLDKALRLVDAAADVGADAVKFQMFRADDLVTATAETAAYQREATRHSSQRDLLAKLELSLEQFRTLRDRCDNRSIAFLATPFGAREIDWLTELGAPAIKIASTDLTNAPLLGLAAATGAALILSTGAADKREIDDAVALVRQKRAGDRLILLHCVSAYPTPLSAINLRAIATLRRRYAVPCGLSDHTVSTQTGGWAVASGADVLEKHFTLDPDAPGPDHAMSLDPSQMKDYIRHVRDAETALGDGRVGVTECQREVRLVAGRSVVATVDIKAGTRLTPDMMGLKRPGTGIAPTELERIAGRCAAVDIPADTLMAWDMVV